MTRRLRRWALLFVALGLCLAAALYIIAQVAFTPARLVRRLEKRFNLRAQIDEVRREAFPARLEIRGLALGERDDFARKAKDLTERPSMAAPVLRVGRIVLDVSLPSLLVGKLDVRELSADEVELAIERLPDGDNTLGRLFDKPDRPAKKKTRKRRLPGEEKDREREDVERRFTADNLPVAAKLRSVGLGGVRLVYRHPKKKTEITLSDGEFWLRDIEVDRRDLAAKNQASLEVKAKIAVDRLDQGLRFGDFVARATGRVTPFDKETRELLPEVNCRFDLAEGTRLNVLPLLDNLAKKMAEYEKYGLKMADLGLKTDFTKDAIINLRYKDELFTLTEPVELAVPNYLIRLREGAWVETDEHLHHFDAEVSASPEVTQALLSGLGKLAEDKVKIVSPEAVERIVAKRLVDNGKLRVQIETSGDIGDPDVDFMKNLPNPEDLIQEALKEAAKDPGQLLKGLKGLLDR